MSDSPGKSHATKHILELDALGTHWWIEPLDDDIPLALQTTITDFIRQFERTYTRFSDDSLLGQLNARKRLAHPPQEMFDMLSFARNVQRQTGNVFNISVGGELVRRGYGKTGQGAISHNIWDEVKLSPDEINIPSEISLDFGGFGKGWLIDQVGELLQTNGVEHFVINGGGDILVYAAEPIELALEHPLDPAKAIGSTRITRGALAVSSSVKRSWQKDGVRQHHIIDPRTGAPSTSDILSTYIRADAALIADVCATILLIAPDLEPKLTDIYGLKTILMRQDQLS